jgi:hypothetical protein
MDAILFEPVLTMTAAIGSAALLAPLLLKPGRVKVLVACIVLAPLSPLYAVVWLSAHVIRLCDRIERSLPGQRLISWAASTIATGGVAPVDNVIRFNPNRTRKGGKPA